MNAIDMLTQDHQHLRQLLKQMVDTGVDEPVARRDLVKRLERDLAVHTRLEEEIFYPAFALAGKQQGEEMCFEAIEEHRSIDKQALPDLVATLPGDAAFTGRARALKHLVELHLGQEEREMFAQARELMGPDQLDTIGQDMRQARSEWFAEGWPGANPQRAFQDRHTGDQITQGLNWLSEQARLLEERGARVAGEFTKDPAHQIGRGVEQAVGMGARLAGEVVGGIRRGLAQGREESARAHDKVERED